MTTVTMAKYALALLGVALVLFADRVNRDWIGYVGIGLIVAAFFLRFVRRDKGPEDAG